MRLIDADVLMKSCGLETATKYGNKDAEQQKHSYSTLMLYEIADMIEDAPTVEAVQVVHGEWKEATPKGVHSWSKGYARCSACDETIWSGWEMNFCPNCGADMRKKV